MPAERRVFTAATKPVKTERTHEENQERAYIAASRRSDRSLEARIESARRASEIHKKRTGRALRVTEQDVINEEMYEEEDDDIPTQYQRLSAHLHTSSVNFNRKLHDYIATQHGVRNMFMSQYQNPPFQPYGMQFPASPSTFPQMQNLMNQQRLFSEGFNQASSGFTQQPQPFSPQGFQQQQQGFRQAPYHIPQRPQSHQRSASMTAPHPVPNYGAPVPPADGTATTPLGEANRRLSLPPQAFEPSSHPTIDRQARPPLSRSSTSQSIQQQPVSPQNGRSNSSATPPSVRGTPPLKSENVSPTFPLTPMNFAANSQVLNMNPLSMSLPPESQQLVGSALDPNDPRTAIFMSGSDQIPQPFMPTYTYNPNFSDPKSARMGGSLNTISSYGMSQTLAPGATMKLETAIDTSPSTAPNSAMTEGIYSPNSLLTPGGYDYQGFFDTTTDFTSGETVTDTLNEEEFVNWAG